jgi:hypothetical protein
LTPLEFGYAQSIATVLEEAVRLRALRQRAELVRGRSQRIQAESRQLRLEAGLRHLDPNRSPSGSKAV